MRREIAIRVVKAVHAECLHGCQPLLGARKLRQELRECRFPRGRRCGKEDDAPPPAAMLQLSETTQQRQKEMLHRAHTITNALRQSVDDHLIGAPLFFTHRYPLLDGIF